MLLDALSLIFKRMSHAAMRAGRNPEEVRLIAVTKTVTRDRIREAIDCGLRAFGESRVKEAREKILSAELTPLRPSLSWHLIGHLQRNKVKQAVSLFDLIHSVDSMALAEEINRQAENIGKVQRVLVQVKLSEEDTKHGDAPREMIDLLVVIQRLSGLRLEGLMTVPPYLPDEEARPYFRRLRGLRDEAQSVGIHLPELSMGMSHDYVVAIEEGATFVRIGTAIFGDRA